MKRVVIDMQQQRDEGRLGTGVPGLDAILHGGLIPGSVFIVQGAPGAGKTILANQICFHHARTGNKALYVTLLAESHDRLLSHLGRLAFFDPRQVPESIYFISSFDTLARDGLKGVLQLLRSESRERQASLIVLDGLFALEETAQSAKEFRKFINDLTTLAGLIGCTMLLLTNTGRCCTESVEYTMVDGWIELELRQLAQRAERSVRVLKYRGSGFLEGRHTLCIDGGGMHVYPRLEALAEDRLQLPLSGSRLGTGIAGLDRKANDLLVKVDELGRIDDRMPPLVVDDVPALVLLEKAVGNADLTCDDYPVCRGQRFAGDPNLPGVHPLFLRLTVNEIDDLVGNAIANLVWMTLGYGFAGEKIVPACHGLTPLRKNAADSVFEFVTQHNSLRSRKSQLPERRKPPNFRVTAV